MPSGENTKLSGTAGASSNSATVSGGLPLISFLNKWDRPGREHLELLDEIEQQIGLVCSPVTWPVGIAGDFRALLLPRERDDDRRCAEKYGALWERYRQRVPYRIVPFLY